MKRPFISQMNRHFLYSHPQGDEIINYFLMVYKLYRDGNFLVKVMWVFYFKILRIGKLPIQLKTS